MPVLAVDDGSGVFCAFTAAVFGIGLIVLLFLQLSENSQALDKQRSENQEMASRHRNELALVRADAQGWQRQAQEQAALVTKVKKETSAYLEYARNSLHQQIVATAQLQGKLLVQFVKHRLLNHDHLGRVLEVRFRATFSGKVALLWSVNYSGPGVPKVTGYRNDTVLFTEWKYTGEDAHIIKPGIEYYYSFNVTVDGEVLESSRDFGFHIMIPTREQWKRAGSGKKKAAGASGSPASAKQRVEEAARVYRETINAIHECLRKAEEEMRAAGMDEEKIKQHLANLESEMLNQMEEQ